MTKKRSNSSSRRRRSTNPKRRRKATVKAYAKKFREDPKQAVMALVSCLADQRLGGTLREAKEVAKGYYERLPSVTSVTEMGQAQVGALSKFVDGLIPRRAR